MFVEKSYYPPIDIEVEKLMDSKLKRAIESGESSFDILFSELPQGSVPLEVLKYCISRNFPFRHIDQGCYGPGSCRGETVLFSRKFAFDDKKRKNLEKPDSKRREYNEWAKSYIERLDSRGKDQLSFVAEEVDRAISQAFQFNVVKWDVYFNDIPVYIALAYLLSRGFDFKCVERCGNNSKFEIYL